ncbi:HlyD family efflux transporter periplasmic adaptor subunit [Undibacterium cyanobacteriorum]|uniref:HlyD family efflux transporter periplasmic adaptor subunit n=1 Tax=Undibacterium cyanobacteriorum TaxID=3073561 RepID=A0ABY9RM07_9BURK|nr:HlyD family efflux transporter periplasmic adaptor subunit [Undibacterium sp. 20NA77.5]WMW81720.1 HlyD family efflux transporter periplasmic adaptor subunit [Undibacterium sp. 20NA77.5]
MKRSPKSAHLSAVISPIVGMSLLLASTFTGQALAQAQVESNAASKAATNVVAKDTVASAKADPSGKLSRAVLFAGEVHASDSIPILVPTSNVSPVALRYYVPEGARVKAGEVVLRVDVQGNSDIERIELEITQARQTNAREVADLEVRQIEAEKALITARAALAKAKVDAALPKAQIAALDYDKYQGELDRATKDLEVKQKALAIASEAIQRKIEDGVLAVKKSEIQLAFAKTQIAQAEVRAPKDGVVIHGYDSWSGKRLDEGGMGHIGSLAGHIMGNGQMSVVAYVLEADRLFIKTGQVVTVRFDAIPGRLVKGTIGNIAGAPEAKATWGNGRYFKADITLSDTQGLSLQHGMSAAIEAIDPSVAAARKTVNKTPPAQLNLEGDVLSRQSYAVAPPSIQNVWEFNLVMLAPEGTHVKEGQPVAVFEANEVGTRLDTFRSSLKEKQRALEKLKLDQAETLRAADLAVSEAKSNSEKAVRKASLPRELVKRVDYDKLVVERELFAQLAQLAVRQRDAQKRAKEQEMLGMKTELAQLQKKIDVLEKGLKGLTVTAPRAGTVVHLSNFNGEKFAVGSRVFMSSAIANLADPEKLYVSAKVPEAQISLIAMGQKAKVTVPGANTVVAATITAMGPVFHGKSSNQPIVVRDIELEFDGLPKTVKPGTAVQVQLETHKPATTATTSSAVKGAK